MNLIQEDLQCVAQRDSCCWNFTIEGCCGTFRIVQGAYNSGKPGKHGNLREFVNSGKFRENSGNLKFTQGVYQMLLIVI